MTGRRSGESNQSINVRPRYMTDRYRARDSQQRNGHSARYIVVTQHRRTPGARPLLRGRIAPASWSRWCLKRSAPGHVIIAISRATAGAGCHLLWGRISGMFNAFRRNGGTEVVTFTKASCPRGPWVSRRYLAAACRPLTRPARIAGRLPAAPVSSGHDQPDAKLLG